MPGRGRADRYRLDYSHRNPGPSGYGDGVSAARGQLRDFGREARGFPGEFCPFQRELPRWRRDASPRIRDVRPCIRDARPFHREIRAEFAM